MKSSTYFSASKKAKEFGNMALSNKFSDYAEELLKAENNIIWADKNIDVVKRLKSKKGKTDIHNIFIDDIESNYFFDFKNIKYAMAVSQYTYSEDGNDSMVLNFNISEDDKEEKIFPFIQTDCKIPMYGTKYWKEHILNIEIGLAVKTNIKDFNSFYYKDIDEIVDYTLLETKISIEDIYGEKIHNAKFTKKELTKIVRKIQETTERINKFNLDNRILCDFINKSTFKRIFKEKTLDELKLINSSYMKPFKKPIVGYDVQIPHTIDFEGLSKMFLGYLNINSKIKKEIVLKIENNISSDIHYVGVYDTFAKWLFIEFFELDKTKYVLSNYAEFIWEEYHDQEEEYDTAIHFIGKYLSEQYTGKKSSYFEDKTVEQAEGDIEEIEGEVEIGDPYRYQDDIETIIDNIRNEGRITQRNDGYFDYYCATGENITFNNMNGITNYIRREQDEFRLNERQQREQDERIDADDYYVDGY